MDTKDNLEETKGLSWPQARW